jgi:hypothetical protein
MYIHFFPIYIYAIKIKISAYIFSDSQLQSPQWQAEVIPLDHATRAHRFFDKL